MTIFVTWALVSKYVLCKYCHLVTLFCHLVLIFVPRDNCHLVVEVVVHLVMVEVVHLVSEKEMEAACLPPKHILGPQYSPSDHHHPHVTPRYLFYHSLLPS